MLFYSQTKYGSDRFRQIFDDHWERWWDYCREEIPADQRAFVQKVVKRMMGCRNPNNDFAAMSAPTAMRNGWIFLLQDPLLPQLWQSPDR